MLKTTGSSKQSAPRAFRAGNNEAVGGGHSKVDKKVIDLSKSKNKKFKKLMHMPNIGAIGKFNFLTPNAKKIFNHL